MRAPTRSWSNPDYGCPLQATKISRSLLVAAWLTALVVSLAGCTTIDPGPGQPPASGPASPVSSTSAATPEASTTVDCAASRPRENPGAIQPEDLVLGPLVYRGLKTGYPSAPLDAVDGIIFAKIGTELSPDATVTVSVAQEARSWAGIGTEAGPPAGYFSVTYMSCPAAEHANGDWWVGGFTLRNQTSGCLPLDVQVHGEESVRHTVISFWDKACP